MDKIDLTLLHTNSIDKIVIDENRNINIIFKYDVMPEINFRYENRNLVRNPYGKNGKK